MFDKAGEKMDKMIKENDRYQQVNRKEKDDRCNTSLSSRNRI